MRQHRIIASIALAATAAAVVMGCGQTQDERVRQVAESYLDAVSDRDFSAGCELFGWTYLQHLGGKSGCIYSQRVQWNMEPSAVDVVRVRSRRNRGLARLSISRPEMGPSPLTLLLKRRGSEWVIVGQR